ncbi:hypothetical protein [Microlunatus flavus]|uniref:5-methyltetrahydropteroyltriglutamate--homocysteine methyltransferase n=1 Tax=Microlunatus flavus TaxID=1036181 RepID=A0A1H9MKP3_9ACTN|nr:hypothetical protein [Microlunatus flavus]SER24025.1 hypothetical protein SAMN05421756_110177 [Microlunatus flavus]
MTGRQVLLLGSLPAQDADDAMGMAARLLGGRLRAMPDGETGTARKDWLAGLCDEQHGHPDLEVVRPGAWRDYDDVPRLRVRRGHRLYGTNLDYGHAEAARESLPALQRVREQLGRPDLPFQASVPGDFDTAFFTLGPVDGLRNLRAFTEMTLREVREVKETAGDDTVFQIEVPVELVMMIKAPARVRPVVASRLAEGILRIARNSPAGTRFGVHLCVGDLNNRPLAEMEDVSPLVLLANAVTRRWPEGRPLLYVHAPLAAADQPAPVRADYYAPLRDLELPVGVDLVAGFVHERQDLADQRRIRDQVDDLVGLQVDVAAACGLGRRTREAAERNLAQAAALAED